jgi:hypothetical protein
MGWFTHRFRGIRPGVDSLALDAINLQIESITYHEKAPQLPVRRAEAGPTLPQSNPRGGHWDSVNHSLHGPSPARASTSLAGKIGRVGLAAHILDPKGQGTDHRYWIPAYDDPQRQNLSPKTYITFDSRYQGPSLMASS